MLCPYCLQRNPAPAHVAAHEANPTPTQYQNQRMIAARGDLEE